MGTMVEETNEPDNSGWDNPINENGSVWVLASDSADVPRKPDVARLPRGACYVCNSDCADEGILLSMLDEGPWLLCRKCVKDLSQGLDFIAGADW